MNIPHTIMKPLALYTSEWTHANVLRNSIPKKRYRKRWISQDGENVRFGLRRPILSAWKASVHKELSEHKESKSEESGSPYTPLKPS